MAARPFVVDPVLTAMAVGYKNPTGSLIADSVLPRISVGGEKFKWTEYPLSEAFNTPDARVGRKGEVQQLEFGGTEQTAEVEDFGLDTPIPYSDIDSAATARSQGRSSYDPEGHSVSMLTGTVELIREARVANMVFNLNTYTASRRVTLSGTSQLSDYVNSDPIGVLKAGMDGTLVYRPNTAILGQDVWSKLSSHPHIVNAVKGNVTSKGMVTREQFLELLSGEGITNLLIGTGWVNTAKTGQPVNLVRVWGKHIALIHNNPMASIEGGGITFGATAQYGGRIAGRIEDPKIGLQGGVLIRSGERVKELIIAKDVGYFIQNAVA
jgi:hypothetical protein